MEVQMFLTHVPAGGCLGPWTAIEGVRKNFPLSVRVTAFRPDQPDRTESMPIWGEIEWHDQLTDRTCRRERFNSGMVEIVQFANAALPRLRFDGEGLAGGRLRVVVQLREVAAA